jgi:lysozyme
MRTSTKGIECIKKSEGCLLRAYDDLQPNVILTPVTKIKGTLTIGYGHTGLVDGKKICWNTKITKGKATLLLIEDLDKFEKLVMKYNKKYQWTQNEFDALVSFALNIGSIRQLTAFGTRSKAIIARKMLAYNKMRINGKLTPVDGLTMRREKEQALFLGI